MWYKRHYLIPLHGVSTAVLRLLKFQPSYCSLTVPGNVSGLGCTNLRQLHGVWWHHLWGLGMELSSYHPSDAKNLEGMSRFSLSLSPRLGCLLDGRGYTFWMGLEIFSSLKHSDRHTRLNFQWVPGSS